ncbi:MAG: DUF2891 family protein, partial [Burkholderiales bacterium]|nr:DUF2891 family protein [Burkholderiales bacterium]
PGLNEADLMRRVLAPEEFRAWLARFLPNVKDVPDNPLLTPV